MLLEIKFGICAMCSIDGWYLRNTTLKCVMPKVNIKSHFYFSTDFVHHRSNNSKCWLAPGAHFCVTISLVLRSQKKWVNQFNNQSERIFFIHVNIHLISDWHSFAHTHTWNLYLKLAFQLGAVHAESIRCFFFVLSVYFALHGILMQILLNLFNDVMTVSVNAVLFPSFSRLLVLAPSNICNCIQHLSMWFA